MFNIFNYYYIVLYSESKSSHFGFNDSFPAFPFQVNIFLLICKNRWINECIWTDGLDTLDTNDTLNDPMHKLFSFKKLLSCLFLSSLSVIKVNNAACSLQKNAAWRNKTLQSFS